MSTRVRPVTNPPPSRSRHACHGHPCQYLSRLQGGERASKRSSRDVLYPILVLERRLYLVRQLTRNLDGVDAADVAVEALPLCDPGPGRVGEGDEAFKDLRGAALNLVLRAREVQKLLAVGAALVAEALEDARRLVSERASLSARRGASRRRGPGGGPVRCRS